MEEELREEDEESQEEDEQGFESGLEQDIQEDSMNMGSVIPSKAPVLESTPIDEPVQNLEQEMQAITSSKSSEGTEEPAYAEQSTAYEQVSYEQPGGTSMQRDREIAIRPSLNAGLLDQNQTVNLRQFQQQTMGSELSMRDMEREYVESNKGQGTKSKGVFGRERAF